jgi:hypothetical protein
MNIIILLQDPFEDEEADRRGIHKCKLTNGKYWCLIKMIRRLCQNLYSRGRIPTWLN